MSPQAVRRDCPCASEGRASDPGSASTLSSWTSGGCLSDQPTATRWAAGTRSWWLPGQQWTLCTCEIFGNLGSCEQGILDIIVKLGWFHRICILLMGSERCVCCSWSSNPCFWNLLLRAAGRLCARKIKQPCWHMKATLGPKDKYSEIFVSAQDAMHPCTLAVE